MLDNILNGVKNGLINSNEKALESYKPSLLINDIDRQAKVLSSIDAELSKCDEFYFSVAFITESGVAVLVNSLKELENKGVKGTIIASQYQNFTEPKALRRLLKFKNIKLRIVTDEKFRMHSKGYIFRIGDEYSFIVGSSNLTQNALCENKEWNVKFYGSSNGMLIKELVDEFKKMESISTEINEAWITEYEKIYKAQKKYNLQYEAPEDATAKLVPNKMQVEALKEIENIRALGADKALIVSATGTGKTYLSAFDVQKFHPKKFLFIVHREQIAKAALNSYKKVLGKDKKMAVLGGGKTDVKDADYVFAMIQTLTNDDILHNFKKDEFDYIVMDEVHRAGAPSYQKVFNYFKPKFLLGMSATPERTDGFNIFEMFDYNLAYEIRLQDAMKEDLICPFHYYGVTDINIDGTNYDDLTLFRKLTSQERVKHIIEKIEFYGYNGDRVKGLVFCSRNEEAAELSKLFNNKGYRTIALSGADSQSVRDEAVARLEQDENNARALDYIFTVDIFNEGVDIPAVNQVIMLRPTESAIIFVQQLGRGLRKLKGKEYVVVIDFIANYDKNYLIPIALSGDNSYNKDNVRRYVSEGSKIIPGASTVQFEEVVREKIYQSIDKANFSNTKLIYDSYQNLKQRLNRIPTPIEFEPNGAIDFMRLIDAYECYHNFLLKKEKNYNIRFSELEVLYLKYISTKFASGKRPHELEFLKLILNNESDLESKFEHIMKVRYSNIKFTKHTMKCVINQFAQEFLSGSAKTTFAQAIFIEKQNGKYVIAKQFRELLANDAFRKQIEDVLLFAFDRYKQHYSPNYSNTCFMLYQKYTYEDVCRGLDWEKSEVALNIGGYKYDKTTKTYPIFINYDKADDVAATINYKDRFVSKSELIAISKNNRTIESDDIQTIINAQKNNVDIELFVRKNKNDPNEAKEFYYLGKLNHNGNLEEITSEEQKVVEIGYNLETPVRDDLYEYIMA